MSSMSSMYVAVCWETLWPSVRKYVTGRCRNRLTVWVATTLSSSGIVSSSLACFLTSMYAGGRQHNKE